MAGNTAGSTQGQIKIGTSASLDGTLSLNVLAPFQPAAGNIFELLTYQSATGQFATVQAPSLASGLTWKPEYGGTSFRLRVNGPPPVRDPNDPYGALHFDGSSSAAYVTSLERSGLNAFPLTLMAWIRTDRTAQVLDGIVSKYADRSANGYSMTMFQGHLRAFYFRDANDYVSTSDFGLDGGAIADGHWQHVAFVVDGSGGRLFVDALQTAQLPWKGTAGPPTALDELQFGKYSVARSSFLGDLDEVILLNGALAADQISKFSARRINPSDDSRIIGLWHFDEKTGSTTADSSGNGRTATLLGSIQWIDSPVPAPSVP